MKITTHCGCVIHSVHRMLSSGYKNSVLNFPSIWNRVGSNFSRRVPGFYLQLVIRGGSTKISIFKNLKLTQNMGSNHFFYFFPANLFIYQMIN